MSSSTTHTPAPWVPIALSLPGPLRLESGKEPAEKLWKKAQYERGSGDGMGGLCFSAEMPMDHRAADVHQSSRLKGTSFQRNL